MTRAAFSAFFALLLCQACTQPKNTRQYLGLVLDNLEKIESATYTDVKQGWAPGDTAASATMHHYTKEYHNPLDTTIGASFVALQQHDTTRLAYCYDGKMSASLDEDEKTISIDSFNTRKLPFRPLAPPFFNYTRSILAYALHTADSVSVKIVEEKEAVRLHLTIHEDRQVEFFGKAHHMPDNPYNFGETTSRYEIWIDKATDLPFKVRREMSHNISAQTVSRVVLNKAGAFQAAAYFTPGYAITFWRADHPVSVGPADALIGRKAPDWLLKDGDDKPCSLRGLKGKVVLVQFTSVSCGPCLASIPFLNKLSSAYRPGDLDFAAVECTSRSPNALKHYRDRHAINYPFLQATKDVVNMYGVRMYPVFFILDKNRIVRKVLAGYGEGKTDEEIKAEIGRLL